SGYWAMSLLLWWNFMPKTDTAFPTQPKATLPSPEKEPRSKGPGSMTAEAGWNFRSSWIRLPDACPGRNTWNGTEMKQSGKRWMGRKAMKSVSTATAGRLSQKKPQENSLILKIILPGKVTTPSG